MRLICDYDPSCLFFLPFLVLSTVECDCCGEDNGWGLLVGWFFWSVNLFFPGNHDKHA
jgi:hypothetical protein